MDVGCFQDGSQFINRCPHRNDFCATYLYAYMSSSGYLSYKVGRKCQENSQEEECSYNSFSSGSRSKNCTSFCDPIADGIGCNVGLEDVSHKFESGNNVTSCFQCDYSGSSPSSSGCVYLPDDLNGDENVKCPRYANTACLYASAIEGTEFLGIRIFLNDSYYSAERTNLATFPNQSTFERISSWMRPV